MLLALASLALGETLLDFGIRQWRQEPEVRIEDAYKWLFHATMGGEHAVMDESGPRTWMDREWATLTDPLVNEPEVVPLRPDGKVVRINLRPYRSRGGDKEMLLAIFVASAGRFSGDRSTFVSEWKNLGARLAMGPIGRLSGREWKRLDQETRRNGYPAIHHSEPYERLKKPAYRVVLGGLWVR